MRCHPDAACDDRELRSGPCAVAAACLEKCVADPGGEACDMPCHGLPLRSRATDTAPPCVEINQCVGCTRQFFTKSFLGDGAVVLRLHAWLAARDP